MGTINSLEDLINSDNIKFGCVRGGATENFFKNSKVRFYNNVWERMNAMDSMTSSNAEVYTEEYNCKHLIMMTRV